MSTSLRHIRKDWQDITGMSDEQFRSLCEDYHRHLDDLLPDKEAHKTARAAASEDESQQTVGKTKSPRLIYDRDLATWIGMPRTQVASGSRIETRERPKSDLEHQGPDREKPHWKDFGCSVHTVGVLLFGPDVLYSGTPEAQKHSRFLEMIRLRWFSERRLADSPLANVTTSAAIRMQLTRARSAMDAISDIVLEMVAGWLLIEQEDDEIDREHDRLMTPEEWESLNRALVKDRSECTPEELELLSRHEAYCKKNGDELCRLLHDDKAMEEKSQQKMKKYEALKANLVRQGPPPPFFVVDYDFDLEGGHDIIGTQVVTRKLNFHYDVGKENKKLYWDLLTYLHERLGGITALLSVDRDGIEPIEQHYQTMMTGKIPIEGLPGFEELASQFLHAGVTAEGRHEKRLLLSKFGQNRLKK